MPIKRGIADAARRLYTERAALRYDGLSRQIRMADVIELTHPSPRDERQSALFKYLLDRRHHDDAVADAGRAAGARGRGRARRRPDGRASRGAARPRSGGAGRGGLLVGAAVGLAAGRHGRGGVGGGHPVDGRDGARAQPAQLRPGRHLRAAIEAVIAKITDADEVAKARLFPYQVWAAYKHAPSDNWKRALGRTLELTVANIPALDGTLVVIDTSGSMQARCRAARRCSGSRSPRSWRWRRRSGRRTSTS